MRSVTAFIERRFGLAFGAALALLLLLAWTNRFMQGDAFIAFRYARHLADGQGLVYNLGERVEGYTCFLYTLIIALVIRLGIDPVRGSWAIGLLAFAGSLAMTCRLATRLTGSRAQGLAAMTLLGLNYTFSAYATGGLETSLFAFLVAACLSLAADMLLGPRGGTRRPLAWSVLAALAVLTRPDAVLVLLPVSILLLADALAPPRPPAPNAAPATVRVVALLLPAAVLLGAWLIWKLHYYGDLLANTFYAKQRGSPLRGFDYVYQFISSYWLQAPLVFAWWRWRDVLGKARRVSVALVVSLALWTTYLVSIGGDFMEFRMFVVVLPILMWLFARTAAVLAPARLGGALASVILLGSLTHAVLYNRTSHLDRIESVWHLGSHLVTEEQNWIGIGDVLARTFHGDTSVVIATTAAGAIPYRSDLTTIDMCGLNDRWIARHGLTRGAVPGHARAPSLDYLLERRVNLLIGHPQMVWDSSSGPMRARDVSLPPAIGAAARHVRVTDLQILEIPIDRGYRLRVIELTPNASIDRAIREHGWVVRKVIS